MLDRRNEAKQNVRNAMAAQVAACNVLARSMQSSFAALDAATPDERDCSRVIVVEC